MLYEKNLQIGIFSANNLELLLTEKPINKSVRTDLQVDWVHSTINPLNKTHLIHLKNKEN